MPTCSLLFWSWSVSIKLRGWLQTLLRKFHKTNLYENNNTNPCPKENICSYLRISIDFQQMQEINFWTCKLISYYLFKNHTSTPLLLLLFHHHQLLLLLLILCLLSNSCARLQSTTASFRYCILRPPLPIIKNTKTQITKVEKYKKQETLRIRKLVKTLRKVKSLYCVAF